MTTDREVMQQALEALEQSETWVPDEGFGMLRLEAQRKHEAAIIALKAALEQPEQPCNCRWVGDVQTQQCTLHEAHVDAIHEWAERAKAAEKKLFVLAEPETCKPALQIERADARRPLTEEEMHGLCRRAGLEAYYPRDGVVQYEYERRLDAFARAIERAHKIGGNDE
jgi:hypothetical protein